MLSWKVSVLCSLLLLLDFVPQCCAPRWILPAVCANQCHGLLLFLIQSASAQCSCLALDRLITHYRHLAMFNRVSVVSAVHRSIHKYLRCAPGLTFTHIYVRAKAVVFAYQTGVSCEFVLFVFSNNCTYTHTNTLRKGKKKKKLPSVVFLCLPFLLH